jgi:hypothetical protein
MSEAIKLCKALSKQLHERFEPKLVGVPEVVVNEELQKKQFKRYKPWFDTQGYLFHELPAIDFSVSTFEKIAKTVKQFELTMNTQFSEFTGVDNEKGIKFMVKRQMVVLMHDRFLIRDLDRVMLGENSPTEKLADALIEFYWEYGDHKKKTTKLDRATSIHL